MNYCTHLFLALKDLDQRRRLALLVGVAALLAVALLLSLLYGEITGLSRKRNQREADLGRMMKLTERYRSARMFVQRFGGRIAPLGAGKSPANLVEETGIKGKALQVTPLKSEQQGAFREDAVAVKLEGVTANEAINFIYHLESGPHPVIIRRAVFKTRFDDPSKLDLTAELAVLSARSPGQR